LENAEEAIKKGQSKETGSTGHTRRIKTNSKHNMTCVGHHQAQIYAYKGIYI